MDRLEKLQGALTGAAGFLVALAGFARAARVVLDAMLPAASQATKDARVARFDAIEERVSALELAA